MFVSPRDSRPRGNRPRFVNVVSNPRVKLGFPRCLFARLLVCLFVCFFVPRGLFCFVWPVIFSYDGRVVCHVLTLRFDLFVFTNGG